MFKLNSIWTRFYSGAITSAAAWEVARRVSTWSVHPMTRWCLSWRTKETTTMLWCSRRLMKKLFKLGRCRRGIWTVRSEFEVNPTVVVSVCAQSRLVNDRVGPKLYFFIFLLYALFCFLICGENRGQSRDERRTLWILTLDGTWIMWKSFSVYYKYLKDNIYI